ncbi:MAG: bifunctional methylenetetrahydrofolate dehydrogenase/methenyltetrahydrofolate cyclohydrolase FolD [Geminicoccaceae bacterium]|nr:bifunctional methylenetetrahydrofolate dehydrogenase/methenyltetrahydrofolate cyclohydrolase FolD [Geminicoccaceae bacterium]
MNARVIDGKAMAAELRTELAALVDDMPVRPGLRVIIVGDNPASRAYVRTKTRNAAEVGMDGSLIEMPVATTTGELLAEIERLNADPATHGILVQLPLPEQIDETVVLDAIDPAKDVDGFHPLNVGRLFSAGREIADDLLVPCTPYGCLHMLKKVLGEDALGGMNAVIVGRSNIVGKPMAALLLSVDCTVTIAHSRTRALPEICREADILVAAVGRAEMVRGEWIKHGATVIDVGINRVSGVYGKSHLVGDVHFASASEVAGAITPVPGGVGPMTVACLLRNTLVAAKALTS